MDAVKLFKEMNRICEHYSNCDGGCPLKVWCYKDLYLLSENPEEVIETVEKWSAEHPKKTRQSEFLKMFPNVPMENGFLLTNPCWVDSTVKCLKQKSDGVYEDAPERCVECREEYWLAEVE